MNLNIDIGSYISKCKLFLRFWNISEMMGTSFLTWETSLTYHWP